MPLYGFARELPGGTSQGSAGCGYAWPEAVAGPQLYSAALKLCCNLRCKVVCAAAETSVQTAKIAFMQGQTSFAGVVHACHVVYPAFASKVMSASTSVGMFGHGSCWVIQTGCGYMQVPLQIIKFSNIDRRGNPSKTAPCSTVLYIL